MYRVLQIANLGGTAGTDTVSQVFEVKATPAPEFSYTSCSNYKVTVTITDKNYDQFTVNFGDGVVENNRLQGETISHTYTTLKAYTINVSGSYNGSTCSNTSSQTVQVLPAAKAASIKRLEVVKQAQTNGELTLELTQLTPGYIYVVERTTGTGLSFTTIDTIKHVTSTSYTYQNNNFNTAEAASYRISMTDKCKTAASMPSNVVSAIALQVKAGDKQATLTWSADNTFTQDYEVYQNGVKIKATPKTVKSYTATDLECGRQYCYYITGLSPDQSITSVSAPICVDVTATSIPPAPVLLSTFNENNEVELTLQIPGGESIKQADLERSLAGGTYQPLTTIEDLYYTDAIASVKPVCYRATYTNPCNVKSPLSAPTCPVILQVKQQNASSVTLAWTNFVGFPIGSALNYTVELLDAGNNVTASYPASGNSYTDQALSNQDQELRYRIKVSSGSNPYTSYSNIINVQQELQLFIPSAFTPNNDGLNDEFEVKGKFYNNFSITIYNRLGNVLYQSDNAASGWNGRFQGEPVAAGVYTYTISVQTASGQLIQKTGTVTLLR
jgi:gliding motility-associated-like protein